MSASYAHIPAKTMFTQVGPYVSVRCRTGEPGLLRYAVAVREPSEKAAARLISGERPCCNTPVVTLADGRRGPLADRSQTTPRRGNPPSVTSVVPRARERGLAALLAAVRPAAQKAVHVDAGGAVRVDHWINRDAPMTPGLLASPSPL